MIDKLYKLKQQQITKVLLQKQQLISKINDIDEELQQTNQKLHSVGLDIMGAISDFRVLEIHKATMKNHMVELGKKVTIKKQVEQFDLAIVELNKESEQFNYILKLQKKERAKEILKHEEMVTAEYMQAKFIKAREESI